MNWEFGLREKKRSAGNFEPIKDSGSIRFENEGEFNEPSKLLKRRNKCKVLTRKACHGGILAVKIFGLFLMD